MLAAVAQIGRLEFSSSDLTQFAGIAQWLTVAALSGSLADDGPAPALSGLVGVLGRIEGARKVRVGLACVRQLCDAVDASLPERHLEPLLRCVHGVVFAAAAGKPDDRRAWDRHAMVTLQSVWRLLKARILAVGGGDTRRTGAAVDEGALLTTVSLLLPDALSDARHLAGPGDRGYVSWCEASEWSAATASSAPASSGEGRAGGDEGSQIAAGRAALSSLSAFSRSGIPFRAGPNCGGGGGVPGGASAVMGARCLVAAVSRIYDGLPAHVRPAAADDCAHALLAAVSAAEGSFAGVHSGGRDAHAFVCKLLEAAGPTGAECGALAAATVTLLRLVGSDAPLSTLEAVLEWGRARIGGARSGGIRDDGMLALRDAASDAPPKKRARRAAA